jgi:hypothetical protein
MKILTEEQKKKIIGVLDDVLFNTPEEPTDPEYITEYDLLMEKKEEEFKLYLLGDEESLEIESLIEMCDKYLEEKENPQNVSFGSEFGLIMMYDMWINECPFWPTNNPDLWKEWEELKKIKVRKRDSY